MKMKEAAELLLALKQEERRVIYECAGNVKIAATQTGKHSPHDFAVSLTIPGKAEFKPTHIRLLVDLYIKKESDPLAAKSLFLAIERLSDGEDPTVLAQPFDQTKFPMQLDSAEVNLSYTQLLLIEQDVNFGLYGNTTKTSKLTPPREYTMRFIRWVAAGDTELDQILFAGAGRKYPAPERYSKKIT